MTRPNVLVRARCDVVFACCCADETAAVVCTGLRCLESLLARDSTIELPAHAVAQALQLPALLFSPSSPAQAKAHRQVIVCSWTSLVSHPAMYAGMLRFGSATPVMT